jgi:hypothetical protein
METALMIARIFLTLKDRAARLAVFLMQHKTKIE